MAIELKAIEVADGDLLPIREISRATGVNTVTLRAWERRYGLLVPQRTSKGHRLYTKADIVRVQQVQVWLARGVAISKVKTLLADGAPAESSEAIDSVWTNLAATIHEQLNRFHRARLDHVLAETFALYPAEMVADYLLVPLLEGLQGDEVGQSAKRAFLTSVLQEYLFATSYRQRQAAGQGKILMVSLDPGKVEPLLLLNSLLVHQYQAEYVGCLDAKAAQVCAEALQATIIVLIGYETLKASELQLHLNAWREKNAMPIVLAGNLARVYAGPGLASGTAIYPCATMQQVHTAIHSLVKG